MGRHRGATACCAGTVGRIIKPQETRSKTCIGATADGSLRPSRWASGIMQDMQLIQIRVVPIRRPFPDIARHVEGPAPADPVLILIDVHGPSVTALSHVRAADIPLVTPGIDRGLRPTGSIFPLYFRWQCSPAPTGICLGLVRRDPITRLLRAAELLRCGLWCRETTLPSPPLPRPVFGPEIPLFIYELLKGGLRHFIFVDPESCGQADIMLWCLVPIRPFFRRIRSSSKTSGRHPHLLHSLGIEASRSGWVR